MELLHVTEIIKKLNYKLLVKQKIIPKLFIPDKVKNHPAFTPKRFPPWVYRNKCQCFFGMYIDYMVRKMIHSCNSDVVLGIENVQHYIINQDYNLWLKEYQSNQTTWNSVAYNTFKLVSLMYYIDISYDVFKKMFGLLGKINKQIKEVFEKKGRTFNFNTEFNYENITSHPDLMSDDLVIDIKTTSSFKSMAESSYLQVLSYAAILRQHSYDIKYIGILLPMQSNLIIYDVSSWKHKLFLNRLKLLAKNLLNYNQFLLGKQILKSYIIANVGYTIKKTKTITKTLNNNIAKGLINKPFQIYFRGYGGMSLNPKYEDEDINDALYLIHNFNLKLYVHGCHIINPSHPYTVQNTSNKNFIYSLLKDDLTLFNKLGGHGVVIHTGKPTDRMTDEKGLDEMEITIRDCLPYATKQCPILLETPAGQASELCTLLDELSEFYNRFSSNEKEKFKICIDTCHVFAAGTDPLEYLQTWVKIHGVHSIGLVHFNDSKEPFSSGKDRHEVFGQGYIGSVKLSEVNQFCNQHKIDMVYE